MKLKLDEQGQAVLEDGHPVYVSDDGTEAAVNVAEMAKSLAASNKEAQAKHHRLKEAEARLKLFGDLDPSTAKEALAFREALGDDVDPEKVSTELASLKAKIAGMTSQLEEKDSALSGANATIDDLTVGAQITGSEFVATKVAPALREPGLFRAAYGQHLGRDEKGNVIVKDAAGNTIMSDANSGEVASLDEALPKIVTNPHHLAAGNASGGGEKGNGQRRTTTAKPFADLSREEQVAAINEHGGLEKAQQAHG